MCIVVDFIFTLCGSYLNNTKSDTIFKTIFVILSYCTLNFEFIPFCGFTFVVCVYMHSYVVRNFFIYECNMSDESDVEILHSSQSRNIPRNRLRCTSQSTA
jgi:hypothetical protein